MMMSKSERPKLVIFRTIFKEILLSFIFLSKYAFNILILTPVYSVVLIVFLLK